MIVRKDQEYRKEYSNSYHGFPGGDETAQDKPDEELMRFLSHNCIESDSLIKIRECCKGARYHTYLADMISFLYQLRCTYDEFSRYILPRI